MGRRDLSLITSRHCCRRVVFRDRIGPLTEDLRVPAAVDVVRGEPCAAACFHTGLAAGFGRRRVRLAAEGRGCAANGYRNRPVGRSLGRGGLTPLLDEVP
jgi:hypothetical protein